MSKTNKYSPHYNDELTYSYLGMEDLQDAIALLKNYLPLYDPLCLALGATFEDIKDFVKELLNFDIKQNMSVGVRNNEGELIGLTIVQIEKECEQINWENMAFFAELVEGNETFIKLLKVIGYTRNSYDVFIDQGVKEAMYIRGYAVHPDYRGGDIVVNMVEMAEKKALEKGIKISHCVCTGISAYIDAQRLGMRTVSEVAYTTFDFLDLKEVGSSTHLTVMVKKLFE